MKTPDLFPQSLQHQALSQRKENVTCVVFEDFTLPAIRTDEELLDAINAAGGMSFEVVTKDPLSHRNDPQTSVDAAQSVKEVSKQHRVMCLTALALYGGQTSHEVAARCGFNHWSVAARRITELHEQGTIRRKQTGTFNGKPIYETRKTPSGRSACVWYVIR